MRKESDEVYYADEALPVVGKREIDFLKARAVENARLRCRLCLHPAVADTLHEMIIVFRGDTYFRPLRHRDRQQSFQVLEGAFRFIALDEAGEVTEVIDLAADDPLHPFKLRISAGFWYAFIIQSEWLVLQEVLPGPMLAGDREYAAFSPEEGDPEGPRYSEKLRERVARFLASSPASTPS